MGPGCAAFFEFFGRDVHVDLAFLAVDGDLVAGLDEGDGSAFDGFGNDVADEEAVRSTRKAPIGNQRDILHQSRAGQCGRGGEHFRHAGSAFGAFVADDDDIAFFDFALFEGGEHVFLAVEYIGRAFEYLAFFARDFSD